MMRMEVGIDLTEVDPESSGGPLPGVEKKDRRQGEWIPETQTRSLRTLATMDRAPAVAHLGVDALITDFPT
jgi:hypothetical protein